MYLRSFQNDVGDGDKTSRPHRLSLVKALAASIVLAASVAITPAQASSLTHNGLTEEGAIPGSGEVNVLLFDAFAALPEACSEIEADACLAKVYLPGSETQVHEMSFIPEAEVFTFVEFVFNDTGVAWSDYHMSFTNVEPLFGMFGILNWELDLVSEVEVVGELTESGFDLWLFFNDVAPAGEDLFLAIGLYLEVIEEARVTVTQHPTLGVAEPGTLALFGIGLAGLGFIRRRREAA